MSTTETKYQHLAPNPKSAYRQLFIKEAGIVPWIVATPLAPGPKLETVAWNKDGRTLVLILQNPSDELIEARLPVRVQLAAPVTISPSSVYGISIF